MTWSESHCELMVKLRKPSAQKDAALLIILQHCLAFEASFEAQGQNIPCCIQQEFEGFLQYSPAT